MKRVLPAAAALLMALSAALMACGTEPDPSRWRNPTDTSPTPQASPTPSGPAEITLAFAGDVHFVEFDGDVPNRTGLLLDDPATAFGPIAELLSAADISMINLETAVTEGGTPEPKQFLFRAPAVTWDAVHEAGVDVVSLANNHALDYGHDGLADTIDSAGRVGVPVIGAGPDAASAYAPWIAEVKGVRIAFLGFSQVYELWESWAAQDGRPGLAYAMDSERSLAAVRSARDAADVVVVYMHWGQEGNECPTGEMATYAAALAEAGADIVVGTHAHLLLGDGWIDRTYVQYGLGNFLWWRDDRFSNDTGVLWITLRDAEIESVEFRPASISRDTGQPVLADGAEADRITAKYADLRGCTGLADEPSAAP